MIVQKNYYDFTKMDDTRVTLKIAHNYYSLRASSRLNGGIICPWRISLRDRDIFVDDLFAA